MTASRDMRGTSTAEARLALAERVLGHTFSDRDLLQRAITHPSAIEHTDPTAYYERLEFLGDAVLGFVIAAEIYQRFPEMTEGGLTRVRVSVVNGSVLAEVAQEAGLADAIIMGGSERGTGGRGMASALENVYEALTGALYIDAGVDAARDWVLRTLGPRISAEAAEQPENPKSALQERLQAEGEAPTYRITRHEGPPHDRTFFAEVLAGNRVIGEGSGRSKQDAEKDAAASALEALGGAQGCYT